MKIEDFRFEALWGWAGVVLCLWIIASCDSKVTIARIEAKQSCQEKK